jgi:hypothetical protein
MTLTTSQLRAAYGPHCSENVRAGAKEAYGALNAAFKAHNYRVRTADTGARSCRRITGGSGYSLHAFFIAGSITFWTGVRIGMAVACDVNWQANPYGPRLATDMPRAMIDDIYKIRTRNGKRVWGWGGYYTRNKDAMHFEIVCSPADLATGIDPRTLPGGASTGGNEDDMSAKAEQQISEIHNMISGQPKGLPYGLESVLGAVQAKPIAVVIDNNGDRWVTDLISARRKFPGGHPFLTLAQRKFGADTVTLDAKETALFIKHVPEVPTSPGA